MSDHTLQFPIDIKEEIGLNEKEINAFKGRGCRFYGRKTCVAWVREYLLKVTGSEPAPTEHLQPIDASKSGGPTSKSGSPDASPATH